MLFEAASQTIAEVAANPRHLGARDVGILAVLHTWGQNLMHHPHLHCVVSGGGLSADGEALDRFEVLSPGANSSHASCCTCCPRASCDSLLRLPGQPAAAREARRHCRRLLGEAVLAPVPQSSHEPTAPARPTTSMPIQSCAQAVSEAYYESSINGTATRRHRLLGIDNSLGRTARDLHDCARHSVARCGRLLRRPRALRHIANPSTARRVTISLADSATDHRACFSGQQMAIFEH